MLTISLQRAKNPPLLKKKSDVLGMTLNCIWRWGSSSGDLVSIEYSLIAIIPKSTLGYNLIRCPWCNGYRPRKWTQRHEFKSWTRLIAFSHSTNTLGKGMNPIILPPAMDEIVGQTRFFSFGEATSLGEGKLWIQIC